MIDLGTGDGRAVVARARTEPGALVIGVDAAAAAMTESSTRAARPARKGGLPNALFLVAAAERLPAELAGIAAEVTITMPWGSLLRGALAGDDSRAATAGIAGLVGPGGIVRILASVGPRDRLGLPPLRSPDREPLAGRWAEHGLTLTAFEPASQDDIEKTASSWARRLGAGRDREVWQLDLHRTQGPPGPIADRR